MSGDLYIRVRCLLGPLAGGDLYIRVRCLLGPLAGGDLYIRVRYLLDSSFSWCQVTYIYVLDICYVL